MRHWLVCAVAAAKVAATAAPAAAGEPVDPPAVQAPISVVDVAEAPAPRDASGIAVPPEPAGGGWRWTRRAIYLLPRWGYQVLLAPARGGAYAYERYELRRKFKQIFFNEAGTVGLFPLVFIESGFGFSAGVRFIHRDLAGHDERLKLDAKYGGRFRQSYEASLSSGALLGPRVGLELELEYQLSPQAKFYGIGNGDALDEPPSMPIDPLAEDTAFETRYRYDDFRTQLGVALRAWRPFIVRASGALRRQTFGATDDDTGLDRPIDAFYDPAGLVGFREGLLYAYGELELGVDTRRVIDRWLSVATPSTGWKVVGFAGYAGGFGDDPSSYARYGGDVQRYVDLYRGDRVLMLRAVLEAVTGDLGQVPFTDLPSLGGPLLLRGYQRDRFRDRITTLVSAEYTYPVVQMLAGYLFVDAGRPWRSYGELGLSDWRVGFGGGMQFQTKDSFLGRVSLSSSIDGGLLFNFSFSPVSDAKARQD